MTAQLMATYPHVTTTALDADQLEAVNHLDGPCLVLAGPGSGKTRVIVERVLALLSRGVALEQQLVLTYTRKAADEMRSRAEAAHGPFAAEPMRMCPISTRVNKPDNDDPSIVEPNKRAWSAP